MSEDFKFIDMTNMLIDTALGGIADQENKEKAERMLAARKVWLRALQKIAAGEYEHARVGAEGYPAVKVYVRERGQLSARTVLEELNAIAHGYGYEVRPCPEWYSVESELHKFYICERRIMVRGDHE